MTPRRRLAPWLWAAATLAALAVLAVNAALGATVYGVGVGDSLAVALVLAVAVLTVQRFPRLALGLVTAGAIGEILLVTATPTAPWPVPVATLLAALIVFAVAALRGHWVGAASGTALIGIVAGGIASGTGSHLPPGPVISNLIVTLALLAAAVGAALLVRAIRATRGELAAVKEVSELELARRQVAEERTRIAREMHDVVAHGMSVIQVQAASARYRYPDLDAPVADEFDDLAATARTALGEMRALLGVLRADDDAEQAPQPGLAQLPELVARSRAELDDQLPPAVGDRLDPVCALAVYRVAQESLGNAARHAPGTAVRVTLEAEATATTDASAEVARTAGPEAPAQLRITVENAPPTAASAPAVLAADRSGHGIRGMRERVAALGGGLWADHTPAGGFRVVALVPVTPGTPIDPAHASIAPAPAAPTTLTAPVTPAAPTAPAPPTRPEPRA
ncbi:sensor histidine kinase [Leucobacter luti]|uniref:histidine kinase n=1 Tax=Leucobacter luti TaxID=340320 RepID=A0A4Q7TQ77_9MICO|nr:histidine kinase [Leucobacter luti]MBL3699961.1 sensor histidine kinase [Leucobacter luti]RZT62723.1 signal transduction histidine kinase [Leucobacter luti]